MSLGIARVFTEVNSVEVEVFDPPFFQKTRDLTNGCFISYERAHNGRELNWDTPNGDAHAERLLRAAIAREAREATGPWGDELGAIRRSITGCKYGPLQFLYALAWDGGGRRPIGALYDWDEPCVKESV